MARKSAKWLGKNLTNLERLQGRVLYSLAPEDFQHILDISSSFRDCGAPPTTYGKALHFFLPETVMLWDQAIVRNTYKLGRSVDPPAKPSRAITIGMKYRTVGRTRPEVPPSPPASGGEIAGDAGKSQLCYDSDGF